MSMDPRRFLAVRRRACGSRSSRSGRSSMASSRLRARRHELRERLGELSRPPRTPATLLGWDQQVDDARRGRAGARRGRWRRSSASHHDRLVDPALGELLDASPRRPAEPRRRGDRARRAATTSRARAIPGELTAEMARAGSPRRCRPGCEAREANDFARLRARACERNVELRRDATRRASRRPSTPTTRCSTASSRARRRRRCASALRAPARRARPAAVGRSRCGPRRRRSARRASRSRAQREIGARDRAQRWASTTQAWRARRRRPPVRRVARAHRRPRHLALRRRAT